MFEKKSFLKIFKPWPPNFTGGKKMGGGPLVLTCNVVTVRFDSPSFLVINKMVWTRPIFASFIREPDYQHKMTRDNFLSAVRSQLT